MKKRRLCLLAVWLLACVLHAQTTPADSTPRKSGFEFMSPATQAMQRDDTLNPAMLWVKQGEGLWQIDTPNGNPSCAGCHGSAPVSMRGVATRYPAWDSSLQRPLNLSQRINRCRVERQKTPAWRLESQDLLSLETYVAFQSRGLAMTPDSDARLLVAIENGRQRYQQRMGQLDLSCAQCHDQRWGQRLGGSVIPQAYANGYPVYRLEWQGMGSLQRRLRNCINGVRAESFPLGAPELVELELYLAQRSRGMALEAPAVRP